MHVVETGCWCWCRVPVPVLVLGAGAGGVRGGDWAPVLCLVLHRCWVLVLGAVSWRAGARCWCPLLTVK